MSKVYYVPSDDSIIEVTSINTYFVDEDKGMTMFYALEPEKYGWVLLGDL